MAMLSALANLKVPEVSMQVHCKTQALRHKRRALRHKRPALRFERQALRCQVRAPGQLMIEAGHM